MLDYNKNLRQPARQLRKQQTEAERLLWSHLRRGQMAGMPFYRQKPLGAFIVDFYCAAASLVVELDGSHHAEAQQAAYDHERDQHLAGMGLRVLRFANWQVMRETEWVLGEIRQAVMR